MARGAVSQFCFEGPGRAGRVNDLTAFLFECCRFVPELRASIAGVRSEPTRIFVGDNCRSLTDANVRCRCFAVCFIGWPATGTLAH